MFDAAQFVADGAGVCRQHGARPRGQRAEHEACPSVCVYPSCELGICTMGLITAPDVLRSSGLWFCADPVVAVYGVNAHHGGSGFASFAFLPH